jgi:hypothetical protein
MNKLIKKLAIICFLIISVACTKSQKSEEVDAFGNKDFADAFVSQIKPKWFTLVDRFALLDRNKKPVSHRFFDIKPFRNINLKTVNSIIVTP